MSQAGSKKREKNVVQHIISRITPMTSQGMASVGSTIAGQVATSVMAPTGTGYFLNKGISGASKAVDSTGRLLGGDSSIKQWGQEMYKNYLEDEHPINEYKEFKQTVNDIKDKGLVRTIANNVTSETNGMTAPYKNLFNSLFRNG